MKKHFFFFPILIVLLSSCSNYKTKEHIIKPTADHLEITGKGDPIINLLSNFFTIPLEEQNLIDAICEDYPAATDQYFPILITNAFSFIMIPNDEDRIIAGLNLLVENGLNIHQKGVKTGNTFMHWATIMNCPKLVQMLINQGVGVPIENFYGKKALDIAMENGYLKIEEILTSITIDSHTIIEKRPSLKNTETLNSMPWKIYFTPKDYSCINTIVYQRHWETNLSTSGPFIIPGSDMITQEEIKGFFLEPKGPYTTVANQRQRIPPGRYQLSVNTEGQKGGLRVFNEQVSKYGRNILIHSGNYPVQTDGCLLPGNKRGPNKEYGEMVSKSRDLLEEIVEWYKKKSNEASLLIYEPNK